ncbi:MAG: hypothetical protein FJ125_18675 [Deltaproteobacteria bacterium]|nr:hypothetical protein [Deltaproteobacteria bacterium]
MFSIFFTLDLNLELSAWIILWCALLDKLDGMAARLMKASSNFGVEFDSFADFVAFGLAPGFLIYQHAIQLPGLPFLSFLSFSQEGLTWFYRIAVALYILCAGIRLATFNVRTSVWGPDWFYGIPSTYCGAIIASFLLTSQKYGFSQVVVPWTPLFILPLGILMLTPLKLPKIKARKNRFFNLLQGVSGALIYLFGFLRKFPELLFGLAALYLVGGLIAGVLSSRTVVAGASGEPLAQDTGRSRLPIWRRAGRGTRSLWWWRRLRGNCPEPPSAEEAPSQRPPS